MPEVDFDEAVDALVRRDAKIERLEMALIKWLNDNALLPHTDI